MANHFLCSFKMKSSVMLLNLYSELAVRYSNYPC